MKNLLSVFLVHLFFISSLIGNTIIVSDRHQFTDADILSTSQTKRVVALHAPLKQHLIDEKHWTEAIRDKNVVLLIHGYNNDYEEALAFFSKTSKRTQGIYDLAVCYLWPGKDDFWEYLAAKSHATGEQLPKRLLGLIQEISKEAKQVDIIAFSMGCRLILETMKLPSNLALGNIFLMAPAVDNESLEKGEIYAPATDKCQNIFVFFSRNDQAVNIGYPIIEWDLALGARGTENPSMLYPKVHMIDATPHIEEHSDYPTSNYIFKIIKNVFSYVKPRSTTPKSH